MVDTSNINSLNELNIIVQDITLGQNNSPVDDFCGLSPNQMHEFLNTPFNSSSVAFSSYNDPSNAPVMTLFLALANALGADGLKATAKGNLPLNLCKSLAQHYAENKAIKLSPMIGGIRTEQDFGELYSLRIVAVFAGLMRKYRGKFVLTKKGLGLLESEDIGEIYFELFKAYVTKLNWAYRERL